LEEERRKNKQLYTPNNELRLGRGKKGEGKEKKIREAWNIRSRGRPTFVKPVAVIP